MTSLSISNNTKHTKKRENTTVPNPFGPISYWPPLQSSSTERGTIACHAFFSTFQGKCRQSISRFSHNYEWIPEHPLIRGQNKQIKKKSDEQIGPDIESKNSVPKSKSKPSTVQYLTQVNPSENFTCTRQNTILPTPFLLHFLIVVTLSFLYSCFSVLPPSTFLSPFLPRRMSLACFQPSCNLLASCFAFFFLVLIQTKIATSAVIMSMRNHHNNYHHSRPMLQSNQSTCALFVGAWVRDESYPLYESSNCPAIIDAEFNCQMYGRPDSEYLKYRWQPLNCELPR